MAIDYKDRIKHSAKIADKYDNRRPAKHRGEVKLVERTLAHIDSVTTILDAPCGTGRFLALLADRGYVVSGMDLGEGSLARSRALMTEGGYDVKVDRGDLEVMEYADKSFDAVFCFRFFHHLPDWSVRERVIRQLCRVAGRYVLMTYFDPRSITSVRRAIRERVTGYRSPQHATPLREVRLRFEREGFELERNLAVLPVLHTLNMAIFRAAGS